MSADSIQVVTVMGKKPDPVKEWYYRPELMIRSCQKFGYTPVILGQKEGEYRGLGSKAKLLKKALHDGTITASHILFVDAFDIVFGASPLDVVNEFLAMQAVIPAHPSIIWSSERACFSDASLAPLHPPCKSSFKYLNSGFSVGESGGFRKFYAEFDPDEMIDDYQDAQGTWHFMDDQNHAMVAFLKGSLSMALDTNCRICQNYCDVLPEEIEISDKGIRNIETDTYPLIHHFNGPSKSGPMVDPILKRLGYQ